MSSRTVLLVLRSCLSPSTSRPKPTHWVHTQESFTWLWGYFSSYTTQRSDWCCFMWHQMFNQQQSWCRFSTLSSSLSAAWYNQLRWCPVFGPSWTKSALIHISFKTWCHPCCMVGVWSAPNLRLHTSILPADWRANNMPPHSWPRLAVILSMTTQPFSVDTALTMKQILTWLQSAWSILIGGGTWDSFASLFCSTSGPCYSCTGFSDTEVGRWYQGFCNGRR